MNDRAPSGQREFKHEEIPPATFEVGSPLRELGEGVTGSLDHYIFHVRFAEFPGLSSYWKHVPNLSFIKCPGYAILNEILL